MRKIIVLLLAIFLVSCNPAMHIIGSGMRKFNTSQNKYNKNRPYINIKR